MWFRKKKQQSPEPVHEEEQSVHESQWDHSLYGEGPFDSEEKDIKHYDFSDFGPHALDLGSMYIPLPSEADVQIEIGPKGPRMLHIRIPSGRLTPVVFAAPKKSGYWRESLLAVRSQLRDEGFTVIQEEGPWGPEIVASNENRVLRIIGVDGPRWMVRYTAFGTKDKEEELTEWTRKIVGHTVIRRGDGAFLPGDSLPIQVPENMRSVVEQASKAQQEEPSVPVKEEPAPQPASPITPAVGNKNGTVPPIHTMDNEEK